MTIEIFPSDMPGRPLETHEWTGTLGAWLDSERLDWRSHEVQKILVRVNGDVLPVSAWDSRVLASADRVEIRVIPGGSIGKFLGDIFNFVFGWLLPNAGVPDMSRTAGPQSKSLETAQASANQAKLGDAVPELAGRFKRYPDYLVPPRRYFANLREQWLQFHACVGPGTYQINDADVKVGDTPISSLGDDGSYQIYAPGADLSGQPAAQHWHTVSEVGGTSSGTTGLELSTEFGNRVNSDPASYSFADSVVTRANGEYPAGWGAGTIVTLDLPLSYVVTKVTYGTPPFDVTWNRFTGDFRHITPVTGLSVAVTLPGRAAAAVYEVAGSGLDANGAGWIEIQVPAVPDDPDTPDDESVPAEPINDVPAGTYTLEFSLSGRRYYRITTMSPTEITVVRAVRSGSIFAPTSYDDDTTWIGFPSVTAAARIAFKAGQVFGEWTSEFVATPGNEKTTTLEIDFFFPRGLVHMNDDGTLASRSVGVEIQYRSADGGGTTTTVSKVYTQATVDQIGYTEALTIPLMRPAVRVRRVGAGSTSTQDQDTVQWYGLKSRISGVPNSYPNWTTIAVKFRSGGRLGAQSENQVNVIATRKLPTLQADGTWGPVVATRDVSAFVRYIATTIGYTDDNLDMSELRRLHAIWVARGETLDTVFDLTTVKAAIGVALGAGMAEVTIADGLIRPVRDDVRTTFESGHGYSPQNMTKALQRQFVAHRQDDNDGVEVEYTDPNTWTQQTVVCALPGSQRLKLRKMKLDGVTDRTRAWRIGMREARRMWYRLWQYSFETEMDALNSEYLSYVPLLDDIPGYGQSAILEGIEAAAGGALLHTSEPLRWEDGADHVVAYRRPDGTVAGPWPATPGPDEYSLIAPISQPWPAITLKQEPPHVYVGTTERWCFPALVTEIRPKGTDRATVSAVNYDVRVYADDDNEPAE